MTDHDAGADDPFAPLTATLPAPKTCATCGGPATISDGIVGADLCADPACLDAAWTSAFPQPAEPAPTGPAALRLIAALHSGEHMCVDADGRSRRYSGRPVDPRDRAGLDPCPTLLAARSSG